MTKRQKLAMLLIEISDAQYNVFKRMYAPTNMHIEIADIVLLMSPKKLNWAIAQVENTISMRNKRKHKPVIADTLEF